MKTDLTCSLVSLGCKVNQYEIDEMASNLAGFGVRSSTKLHNSDITIINTCSVTNVSDKKSRQLIRKIKKQNPDTFLVVTGCYAQSNPNQLLEIGGINLIIPNNKKNEIADIIAGRIGLRPHSGKKNLPRGKARKMLKIVDGCESYCAYCIIPELRGKIKSRSQDEIAKEFSAIESDDIKEIVLTGINLGKYGTDYDEKFLLADLLQTLVKLKKNDTRIRLSSIELGDIDTDMLDLIKDNLLCDHLHIPLQSGSNRILRLMNRNYSAKDFVQKISSIKKAIPSISISTDIIVGFPGETEHDFQKTIDTVNEIGFSKVHVFKYSPRKGTLAAAMDDQIEEPIKQKRSAELIEVQNELSDAFKDRFMGTEAKVLFESKVQFDGQTYLYGLASNYLKIHVPFSDNLVNNFAKVKINDMRESNLFGELV